MKYKLIGDVHGKVDKYFDILENQNSENLHTIQVGDFGFKMHHDKLVDTVDINTHKILFGNHDFYPYKHKKHSLGDWGLLKDTLSTFFIRGAHSIDWKLRTPNFDWFYDEQLSFKEFNNCLDDYKEIKPKIVISHECPIDCIKKIHGDYRFANATSNFLQEIFELHQPDLWIFGHHHISTDIEINGTRFICLAELEHKDFELI